MHRTDYSIAPTPKEILFTERFLEELLFSSITSIHFFFLFPPLASGSDTHSSLSSLHQAVLPGMLLKPKYGRFRNDSVTSSDDLIQSLAMSGKVVATAVAPSSVPNSPVPPLEPTILTPPLVQALDESPGLDGEQDSTTTFCMLIPKMPHWKFSNSLLSCSPSNSAASSSSKDSSKNTMAKASPASSRIAATSSGPMTSLAAALNSCDPVCLGPCSLQAVSRQRVAVGSASPSGFGGTETAVGTPSSAGSFRTGISRRTRADGIWLGGEDLSHKGNIIHKPSQGWLHSENKIYSTGISYIVKYLGCIEVLKSMRSLDFTTRTQVTREAINRLCEIVPGGKGVWKKKAANKALHAVMGKSNLHFAGMRIAVNISVEGLNLLDPTTRQVIAHHPMQSISFASGGDTDTPDYVAYVAKDPVNQRACHILECCANLAQSIISTIGQAFELQFKQHLHSPPKATSSQDRNARTEESAWEDDDMFLEHDYYNRIPGKEPPLGGVVDSRLRVPAAMPGHIHCVPQSKAAQSGSTAKRDMPSLPATQLCYEVHWDMENCSSSSVTSDGYLRADGHPNSSQDYEEHLYVNTQNLNKTRPPRDAQGECSPESPPKDIFDMRPFEDALRLHEAGTVCVLEDKWPSPPHRRAPVAPTEEQLSREAWYHGRMSRRDAEKLLIHDGDFLVRDSATNPGQYVLTGMHCGLPKHLLLVDPEGVVRTKDMLFDSISHLINYHLSNKLPIVAAESELHLQQVVYRKQ
ncbi:SHC-transforming protein 2 [Tachysurus fulvidraco]|uniref:SHC-transforming protein 2 n=1 Tax=Tachysurus fulvidraco TaxID=1234273 RepID=UPI000F4D2FB6|nr:SHC-transforming protein 2 [Tachysurus fulvidraco]